MAKVTVAIPVYNKVEYLNECFISLENQSFLDFNVLIIDDGSTDGSAQLCDEWASNCARYHVLHFENAGLLQSRRRAIENISEGYIVFLDADDYLRKDAIANIVRIADLSAADVICFGLKTTSASISACLRESESNEEANWEQWSIESAREWVLRGGSNNLCGKAIDRRCFTAELTYSDYGSLMHGEDLLQSLEVLDNANSFVFLNEDLYFYRKNQESSTWRYRRSQLDDIRQVIRVLRKYSLKWTKSLDAYAVGAAIQYCYLFSILELSGISGLRRQGERELLAEEMRSLFCDAPELSSGLKPHYALMAKAIAQKRYRFANLLVRLTEGAKALLKRGS